MMIFEPLRGLLIVLVAHRQQCYLPLPRPLPMPHLVLPRSLRGYTLVARSPPPRSFDWARSFDMAMFD